MMPIIISFHTSDDFYKSAGLKLKNSCVKFGLEHDIREIHSRGRVV